MIKDLEIKQADDEELSKIEKLFLNYKEEYEKIDLDWNNEIRKEIWYNSKKSK